MATHRRVTTAQHKLKLIRAVSLHQGTALYGPYLGIENNFRKAIWEPFLHSPFKANSYELMSRLPVTFFLRDSGMDQCAIGNGPERLPTVLQKYPPEWHRDMGGCKTYGGRKTYQRTRSPENFWTPPKELLVCSVVDFCTGKTEH